MTAAFRTNGRRSPVAILVGGGAASAAVVMRLAEQFVPAAAPGGSRAELVVIDRAGELGGGPYGAGTPPALLLGDKVSALDASGIGFEAWLNANRSRWLTGLIAADDPRLNRWLCRNRDALARTDFAGLYLPRAVFGEFVRARVAQARAALSASGVGVTVLADEAVAVRPYGPDRWRVTLGSDPSGPGVGGGTVVLAVGGLPGPAVDGGADHRYFTHDAVRDLATTEVRLHDLLVRRPAGRRRVVVVGSSAAASEVLYCLEGSRRVAGLVDEFAVVSPSARLPDGQVSGILVPYDCPHLTAAVTGSAELTSTELVTAVLRDVTSGRRAGYTVVDILPSLRPLFTAAFGRLPVAEKRRFVEHDQAAYRKAVRHTPPEYAEAAARLTAQGRLALTRGRMTGLTATTSGHLAVAVADGGSHFAVSAAAVFDCQGFAGVRQTTSPLVTDLLASGTVLANSSGRGVQVDERFAAAPGLFVLGPALAGTARGANQFWSVEDVSLIHTLATRVATQVRRRLTSRTRTLVSSARPYVADLG